MDDPIGKVSRLICSKGAIRDRTGFPFVSYIMCMSYSHYSEFFSIFTRNYCIYCYNGEIQSAQPDLIFNHLD